MPEAARRSQRGNQPYRKWCQARSIASASDVDNGEESRTPPNCASYIPLADEVVPDANSDENAFVREVANENQNDSVENVSDVNKTEDVGGDGGCCIHEISTMC